MHLLDGTADTQVKKTTMSSCAGDARLRRKNPVSARPLKLRLGSRALAARSQRQSTEQQKDSSESAASLDAHGVKLSSLNAASINDTSSSDVNDNERSHGTTNSGRPLIHHQRHNLKTRFQLLKTLGEGTYGKVKLAADRATGEHVAIKYIKKTKIHEEGDLSRIRREIQILSSLRHRHIVNIREVFEKKDKIVLVMDYAQGGELYDYLNKMGRLDEWEARRIFRQMVSALHYCHQNGIVHRDLKLENIILDDEGNVKIADFGLANYYSHNTTLKTFCGSPLYASPEIVNGKPYHGPEVDVWSMGVILYTLVYGAMPFEANSLVSLKQQISDGDYSQPEKPSDAAGLIRHMLTVTASRRATMEDALRHWWVNFGHSLMPNDQPYSPDEEPPVLPYILSPVSLSNHSDPPAVVHTRNQSSISSDSDVELDFRPSRWTPRQRRLDSTGNSLSSSVAGSPAPTVDSGISLTSQDDQEDNPASIASGLLKLPPEVLEILKGCSSKSLAALLNPDSISSGFDLEDYRAPGPCHDVLVSPMCQSDDSKEMFSGEDDKLVTAPSVFDSERKPKRGILKRKGKFSGGDSGCVMYEDMDSLHPRSGDDNAHIPKSGHLPRRLPSFRDEANGIFASRHRATHLLAAVNSSGHTSCSSAIPQNAWYNDPPRDDPNHNGHPASSPSPQSVCNQSMQVHHSSHHAPPSSLQLQGPPAASICLTTSTTYTDTLNSNYITTQTPDTDSLTEPLVPTQPPPSAFTADPNRPSSSLYDLDPVFSYKEQSKVIKRPKSILKGAKLSQMEEARNRLSISSIGSNSSADILDLSYDSGDSDHFVNQALNESPDSLTPGPVLLSQGPDLPSGVPTGISVTQDTLSLTSDFQNLQMNHSQSWASEDGQEILDSKSSLLYLLTRDAQSLL